MENVHAEIERLRTELEEATAALDKAVRSRRAGGKDSPSRAELSASVANAKRAQHSAEAKLRELYESKDNQ